MKFKKTTAGNYFFYYKTHYVFVYRKPHGSWCCAIGKGGEWLYSEGNFTSWMRNLKIVEKWIKEKIN